MSDVEDFLRTFLDKIAVEERYYDQREVNIQRVSSAGANYTSSLFSAAIRAPTLPTLNLFVKVAAANEQLRESGFNRFYQTERIFYSNIARIYDKIQDQHNVRGEDRLVFPKYFGCDSKYPNETIVLENLESRGFTNWDRCRSANWEYAAKAVEELAKFHALSIAYGCEDPEGSKKMLDEFAFELPSKREHADALFNNMNARALAATKEKYKAKFGKFIDKFGSTDYYEKCVFPVRLPVLAHGDFKVTNLMHKVCKDGTVQMATVDYQTLRAGSTVSDLIYFIFTSTDQQFRRQYYERLVEHYYERLGRALGRLGVDVSQVYPRDDFDYEMKRVLPFGLLVAVSVLSIVLVQEQDAPDVQTMEFSEFNVSGSDLFHVRLNEVIEDFVHWGVL